MIVQRIPRSLGRDAAVVLAGASATALAAQVSIPWQPVPFTLQTMAVLACGLTMGARRGALSILTYLLVGACGLPVFAEHKAGAMWLFGMTGGYLWAFVAAAAIMGYVADRGWTKHGGKLALSLTLANVVLLGVGAAWLSLYIGGEKAWWSGVVPFVGGQLAQSALMLIGVQAARRLK